jgi:hypothetical protein
MELPEDFRNRWNTRGIGCNMRNLKWMRKKLQDIDFIASAVGTDPESRGCKDKPVRGHASNVEAVITVLRKAGVEITEDGVRYVRKPRR